MRELFGSEDDGLGDAHHLRKAYRLIIVAVLVVLAAILWPIPSGIVNQSVELLWAEDHLVAVGVERRLRSALAALCLIHFHLELIQVELVTAIIVIVQLLGPDEALGHLRT